MLDKSDTGLIISVGTYCRSQEEYLTIKSNEKRLLLKGSGGLFPFQIVTK